MRVRTQDYGDVTVVELQGDLDADFTDLLQGAVSDAMANHRTRIVLDMSAVAFIDSQGLELLLWVQSRCKDNKAQLRLAGLDENCAKILEVTRLANEFNCYAELAEAVRSFA